MTRYGLAIEVDRCTGCNICVKACKDEYVGNDYPPYSVAQPDTQYGFYPGFTIDSSQTTGQAWVIQGQSWLVDSQTEVGKYPHVKAGYIVEPCMHCDSAPCIKAAQNGAVYKRSDGIVIIDPLKAVGQIQLVPSCPYGRIYWNNDSNVAQKCTLCAHLVDQGKNPKCVDACPGKVIHFGDLDDPKSDASQVVSQRKAQVLNPEFNASPKVYFAGLPKPFLSGKVVDGQSGEYLKGASVTLTAQSGPSFSATATADFLGDFNFTGLTIGVSYTISASMTGKTTKNVTVLFDQTKDIGKIGL